MPKKPKNSMESTPSSRLANEYCEVCKNPTAPLSCTNCRQFNYCSKKHQNYHWNEEGHKFMCEVHKSMNLGH